MNHRLRICVALFFGVLHFAYAQPDFQAVPQSPQPDIPQVPEGPPPAPPAEAVDRPEGLIKLDVMVTDVAGKAVAGLNQSDFHLLENGREQKILSFEAFNGRALGSEPPVRIILLLDTVEI